MENNELPAILDTQVCGLLKQGVVISIDILKIDSIYFAEVVAFETQSRVSGQYLGLLTTENETGYEAVTSNRLEEMLKIIKAITGEFDQLSIKAEPRKEDRIELESQLSKFKQTLN